MNLQEKDIDFKIKNISFAKNAQVFRKSSSIIKRNLRFGKNSCIMKFFKDFFKINSGIWKRFIKKARGSPKKISDFKKVHGFKE